MTIFVKLSFDSQYETEAWIKEIKNELNSPEIIEGKHYFSKDFSEIKKIFFDFKFTKHGQGTLLFSTIWTYGTSGYLMLKFGDLIKFNFF